MLLLTLVEKLKSVISPRMVLAQVSGYDFAIIAHGVKEPWHAMTLGQQVLTVINERCPFRAFSCALASIGRDVPRRPDRGTALSPRGFSGVYARRKGKNQIQFFDPEADGKGAAAADGRERYPDRAG
jgi:GGDEF domain-containing protein